MDTSHGEYPWLVFLFVLTWGVAPRHNGRSPTLSHSHNNRFSYRARTQRAHPRFAEQGFVCRHCGLYVLCDPHIAGVQNRNHCPSCLWSRHLDALSAGDRLAGCRAVMQPIGLTTKRGRNKYASECDGELMLIHQCTVCAKIVMNRIAADDVGAAIFEVFEASCQAGADLYIKLSQAGVSMLGASDRDLVERRLFGNDQAVMRGE
jgi:hypothetical protein